jgi:hypothetical protein
MSKNVHIAFPWPSLPADIRLLILDEISDQKHRGWAQCAAVCKEWQAIFEHKDFSQLALQPSCLEELETLVIRQRSLVQHICLNIDLPRYSCPTCERSVVTCSLGSTIFRSTIIRLFSILSTWPPTGRLTLELNASSPSDSQHWFKNYCFGPGHENTKDWTQQEKAIRWHDPKHGWVDGQQVTTPIRALFCASSLRSAPMSPKISLSFMPLQASAYVDNFDISFLPKY